MELPKKKVPASRKSPKNMILYGPPKIGKTTALASLEGCLIIDLEEGSDMLDALKIQANNIEELTQVGKEILKQNKPYKYIAIDTITKLEEWCLDEAKKDYMKTPMGKDFDKKFPGMCITSLPMGAGYTYLRKAFARWIERVNKLADHVILIGHLKDKITNKKGKEVASKDLALTGKITEITCAKVDAIGYVYRDEDKTCISFNSNGNINAGSRCDHLKGQDMVLDWSKIFID